MILSDLYDINIRNLIPFYQIPNNRQFIIEVLSSGTAKSLTLLKNNRYEASTLYSNTEIFTINPKALVKLI